MTVKKSNPKGGRPKKQKEEKKEKAYTVRVTVEDAKQIEDEASRMNLTISEYFLQCSKNTKLIEPDPNKVKLLSEIGKIGSNLNQITKKINKTGNLSENDKNGLNQIYKQFKAIKESIK